MKDTIIEEREARQADQSRSYDRLDGNYGVYSKVAKQFVHKVKFEDRGDLLHDIIVTLADVERNNGQLTAGALYRIAAHKVADYWRSQYKLTNGLDCGSCSKVQRYKCKEDWLYAGCPKAIKLESLDKPMIDSTGNLTELGELIADDKALDLNAWLDAKTWLLGCPKRLLAIAVKRQDGIPLDSKDREYLSQFRKKEQKSLF